MKILLVGGFLGSGKTSFILQLAHYMVEQMGIPQIAILENEIGELSVDDKLLKGAGYEVRGLFSGCVCCSMAGELLSSIDKIEKELNPEWLIMEATGLAFPGSIRANVTEALDLTCRICCLADAKRWSRIMRAMEQLVTDQMESADMILINKIDLVDEETVKEVRESITGINDKAVIAEISANGELPVGIFEKVLMEE
jgi:G3E family GTPase